MATDEGAFFLDEFFRIDVAGERCSAARAGPTQEVAACALEHIVPGPADRRYDILGCGGEQRFMCVLSLRFGMASSPPSPSFGRFRSTVDSIIFAPEKGTSNSRHGETGLDEADMKAAVRGIV